MLWFGCLWTSEHTMKKNLTPTTQHREAAWSLAVTAAGLPAGLHFFHFRVNGAGGSDRVGQLVLSGVISCKWAVFLRLPIWTSSFMMASCGPGLRSVGRTHPRWKVECTVPQWFHPLGSHGEPEFRAVLFFFSSKHSQCQHHAECQCFLIGFMMFYVLPNLQKNSLLWSWMDFFSFNLNRFGRPSKIWGRYLLNRDGNGQQHSQQGKGKCANDGRNRSTGQSMNSV